MENSETEFTFGNKENEEKEFLDSPNNNQSHRTLHDKIVDSANVRDK